MALPPMRTHVAPSAVLVMLLVCLPACRITFREPELKPINTSRFYDAEIAETCGAVQQVLQDMALPVRKAELQTDACLIETDFKVFSDVGDDPINHLKRSALTGVGSFIGGRYFVTITGRDVRDGGARLRVVTRIEGYVNQEFGYQVLRSSGLIEDRTFAAVGDKLGVPPVEAD